MASKTQIVCFHEGKQGRSVDPVFINTLLKKLKPSWIRPWEGSNVVRLEACGGRAELIARMPSALRSCLAMGGNTTLMVWADLDPYTPTGEQLRERFWGAAQPAGIQREQFDQVVFVFAKDRLENWIEFLLTGATDESREGPRQKHDKLAAEAARSLAKRCASNVAEPKLPPSLIWSCQNWHKLKERMKH